MKITVLSTALLCLASSAALAAPTAATIISSEDVQKVLQLGPKSNDHTIRVIDMGQGYQMAIGIIKRPPMVPAGNGVAATVVTTSAATTPACGIKKPIDGKVGPAGILTHDFTAETYIILAGSGTLVTGGKILDGKRAGPDADSATMNGPTCGGKVTGDYVSTPIKVGDIVVIPAGVPHGWIDSPGITYLSVRPDPKHVLPKAGYKYPGL